MIIYATATIYNIKLLTENKKLATIKLEDIKKPESILSWNMIAK